MAWTASALLWVTAAAAADSPQGLALELRSGPAVDHRVASNVWLHVPAGQSPSPLLPSGPFQAVWTGSLVMDLRSEYRFQAEHSGSFQLEINGAVVLDSTQPPGTLSAPVRLNKGPNRIEASLNAPPEGPAFVRLAWAPNGPFVDPIPDEFLTHETSEALNTGAALRQGRHSILELRCQQCHRAADTGGTPELSKDAPSLEGIGSRLNPGWMARWIADPHALRPQAEMPRTLFGPEAEREAAAIAAYLATLRPASPPAPGPAGKVEAGKALFASLHCGGCHTEGGEADPAKISLKGVREKFAPGALFQFLKQPEAHYAWIRMPNFKLSDQEAADLAAHLEQEASEPAAAAAIASGDPALGRRLVESKGCLTCHGGKPEAMLTAKPLSAIAPGRWTEGCLSERVSPERTAPWFALDSEARRTLRQFAAARLDSLPRHVPVELAERHLHRLQCGQCHGQLDGFPGLAILGGKLRPDWARRFIAGEVPYKPRPWLEARMPAFPKYAETLAAGVAMQHGYPPEAAPLPRPDPELVPAGRKLVSSQGGLSCVSCHAVGEAGATQVFESAGINLAHTGERLLYPYFVRWILNPLQIDPLTKMPMYFEEEGRKSPLPEILNGDSKRQIDALYHYMLLGEKMPPPGDPAAE